MDEAEFEGVAADLDHVVEEGAKAGQGVGRAEQGDVAALYCTVLYCTVLYLKRVT